MNDNRNETKRKLKRKRKQKRNRGSDLRGGRFAPLAQVPLLAFLLSFSFEFLFDSNYQKRISTNVYPQRWRIDWLEGTS